METKKGMETKKNGGGNGSDEEEDKVTRITCSMVISAILRGRFSFGE